MRMPRSPQAAALLGNSALVLLTERVDDGAFLLGQRGQRGVPEVVDRPLPRHGPPTGEPLGRDRGDVAGV
jgi:hypothetical protein